MTDLITSIDGDHFAATILFLAAAAIFTPGLLARLRTEPTVADERDLEGNARAFDAMGARAR